MLLRLLPRLLLLLDRLAVVLLVDEEGEVRREGRVVVEAFWVLSMPRLRPRHLPRQRRAQPLPEPSVLCPRMARLPTRALRVVRLDRPRLTAGLRLPLLPEVSWPVYAERPAVDRE